jgi:hypothetical protein
MKMIGRWDDGVPLSVAPDFATWQPYREEGLAVEAIHLAGAPNDEQKKRVAAYDRMRCEFKFIDDMDGVRCPVSSHIRRANTRDMLDPNPRKTRRDLGRDLGAEQSPPHLAARPALWRLERSGGARR